MANARFGWQNVTLASGTTVAASSAATGYAATNGQNAKRGLVWRSTSSTGDQDYTVTFSQRTIKAVGLVNARPHAGGTVKAEYKDGGGSYAAFDGGTGLFTFPTSHRTRVVVLYNPTGVTATDIKFTFTNTGGVDSSVEIGVPLVIDSAGYFEPSAKLSNDRDMTPIDPSVTRRTIGGQRQTWKKQKPLTLGGHFPVLSRTDVDALMAMWDAVGAADPILFTQQAGSVDQTLYGTLPAKPRYTHVAGDQWGWRFDVEEYL